MSSKPSLPPELPKKAPYMLCSSRFGGRRKNRRSNHLVSPACLPLPFLVLVPFLLPRTQTPFRECQASSRKARYAPVCSKPPCVHYMRQTSARSARRLMDPEALVCLRGMQTTWRRSQMLEEPPRCVQDKKVVQTGNSRSYQYRWRLLPHGAAKFVRCRILICQSCQQVATLRFKLLPA